MLFEINGKVALVTGGASGLGYEIVRAFLKKGLKGVSIVDVDNTKAVQVENDLKSEFGNNSCICIQADVSDENQMKAAFESTVKTFNQLDIVVNNAGVIGELDWKRTLLTNLGGCMCGTTLAIDDYLPKYKSGDEGVIVNISSIAGVMPIGQVPVYSSTKHGIVALSRCFGQESHYKATNVKVITICPGVTSTPILLHRENPISRKNYASRFPELKFPIQKPEFVGKSTADIVTKGLNGSVWVVENTQEPYQVTFPNLRREV